MAALKEGYWDLDGLVFGGSGALPVTVERYDPGTISWRTQDADVPNDHRRAFGRDYLDGPTWSFSLAVVQDDIESALATLEELAEHWRALEIAETPGATSVLRYARGGRTRRIYGRPRKFAYDPNLILKSGACRATAEFVTEDAWHYADVEDRLEVTMAMPVSSGGWVFPVTFPVDTIQGGDRQGILFNEGKSRTPLRVVLHGPANGTLVDPKVSAAGWEIALNTTIAPGQRVTVDTKAGTVKRNDGASLGGTLSRRSRLKDVRMNPGNNEFVFSGIDPSGTSRAELFWRPAYNSL